MPQKVAVIGVGQIGLCLALVLAELGYDVVGIDVMWEYIVALKNRTFRSIEPGVNDMLASVSPTKLHFSTDIAAAKDADIIFILVNTPEKRNNVYDVTILSEVLTTLNRMKLQNVHVVIACTVFPGYCDRIGQPLLRECENVTLTYNPAFVAQGEILAGYRSGCCGLVLVGTESEAAADTLRGVYTQLNDAHIAVMSPASAEICKLAVNCFITMKISFVNMIADVSYKTPRSNPDEICEALGHDTRIGKKCTTAGYGYGGPCFPRDNDAFAAYANSVNIDAMLSDATHKYNEYHHELMAERMLSDSTTQNYVFSDIGYKSGIHMIENSPKLHVAHKIAKRGKKVQIRDVPHVIQKAREKFGDIFDYACVAK